jgi:cytidylate kinase
MNAQVGMERCLNFITTQLKANLKARPASKPDRKIHTVTISRQTGCGAFVIAQKLAEYLQAKKPADEVPWTVFDRDLVEKVLEDHNLPRRLRQFMPENCISEIEDTMDELFGLHPPSWILVRQTAETILRLANLGNAIIIGRGSNIITAKLDFAFHVRLVAPLEKRVERIQVNENLGRAAALKFIRQEDRGRQRYVQRFYQKDTNDPLLYHLIMNTGLMGYENAARIIADCVLK